MNIILSHKKATALAVFVAVALMAGVAYALLQRDVTASGTITGEDGSIAISSTSNPAPTTGPCTWGMSVSNNPTITVDGTKLPSGVTNRCRTTLTFRNDGNTAARVQQFQLTASGTGATIASGFSANNQCGKELAPGGVADVAVALDVSNVQPGTSTSISGQLRFVDSASWSGTACSPVLN